MPEFTWEGFEELKKLIEELPLMALEAAEPAMESAVVFLHGMLPGYPPAIPNSSYVRTGTLGRSFTTDVIPEFSSVVGEIGTRLNYAPWVVGDDFPGSEINGVMKYQAKVHQGRWWQFNDIVNDNIGDAWASFNETFLPAFRELILKHEGGAVNG